MVLYLPIELSITANDRTRVETIDIFPNCGETDHKLNLLGV